MEKHIVTILNIDKVTHNVKSIQFEISLNSDNEDYSDFCFNTGW